MPGRQETLDTGEFYHVFNKTIESKVVFTNMQNASIFKETASYYRSSKAYLSLSRYRKIKDESLRKIYTRYILYKKYFLVDIIAYCIMPTHFHFLIKQTKDKGISKYMSNTINSFTRFYNLLNKRKGPLFLPQFRAQHIRTDSSLLNVSRYIHLNPLDGGVVKNTNQLEKYKFSSYLEYIMDMKAPYIKRSKRLSDSKPVMKFFNDNIEAYKEFVVNSVDYQRTLEEDKK